MNKEPLGLYIFRYIIGFGLFVFMGMLYWSSALIENDLKALRNDISHLKNELFTLRLEGEKTKDEIITNVRDVWGWAAVCAKKASNSIDKADSDFEVKKDNLLTVDPFFKNILPQLLGKGFKPSGTQHLALIGKPENLHPFSNWLPVSNWQDRCNVTVAKPLFGRFETLSPDIAESIEERINPSTGIPEYWVHLRDHVYWQPLQQAFFPSKIVLAPHFLRKHQLTADDFKFYYDAMVNPFLQQPGAVALRAYYDAIKEIEVVDKLTFIVRWKTTDVKDANGQIQPKIKYVAKLLTGGLKPLASFVYKYFANGKKIVEEDQAEDTYRTDSAWAQNFSEHWAKNVIVSCGPWSFAGMSDRQIKFVRNPNFYFPLAALTNNLEVEFKDSADNIWHEFKSGRLDSCILQPDQLIEYQNFSKSQLYEKQAQNGNGIKRLDYLARSYVYIGWNEAKPFFQSAKLRRAMTIAIDRKRIIQQNLNGLGIEITGTFSPYSPSYDASIKPWPFDPHQARRLLEEEGWFDSDGDGIIDKMIDGKRVPFRFTLTYYVKNSPVKAICEYVATALKEIGIDCRINGVDIADLSSIFDDKNFDALCMGWSLGSPPENPRQLWHSSGAKEKGSSNAIGFANKEVDQIIDQLDYEYDPQKRIELYHRFDAIIHEEQPYTFLYTPKIAFLYREYLQNVFIPAENQEIVPGANVAEPDPNIFWIKKAISH